MDNSNADLGILRALNRILASNTQEDDPLAQTEFKESGVYDLLSKPASWPEGQKMLKQLLAKHPSLLTRVSLETVSEIISFAYACCSHYAEIRATRALTEVEKLVGQELHACVESGRRLLETLRAGSESGKDLPMKVNPRRP